MNNVKRKISVFIASPGDLANEREYFKNAIQQLNVGFGDGANVEFEALGWEDTLASTGRRNQGVINKEIDKCDVFILAMHRRWGQAAPDAEPYSSYTEEEFYRALERWKTEGKPEIFVFFKRVDAASEADPGLQLKSVMQFRRQLEETRKVLYHYFSDEQSFIEEVDRHLRAFTKGELPSVDNQRNLVLLPTRALEEVERAKALVLQKTREADAARDAEQQAILKVQTMQLQMAVDAANLSKEGKIEFARQKFAELVIETSNIQVLYLGYEFYKRTGDLESALAVLQKWLSLSGADEISSETADAYRNLGNLYRTRGELERAKEMYQKSRDIVETLDHKEGMASCYSNLGILYWSLGELERAEEMYRKSLAIEESLSHREGMASDYCNLGRLYQARGELERAEDMYQKALAIETALNHKEGMANNYGNLGNLYRAWGDFERAEEMYGKTLAIDKALGRKEGMASSYGNLGILYQAQDDLERAEEMYQKSLAIEKALGRKAGMASDYCNLGILYQARGELENAEEMFQKALAIDEALGRKAGMANNYGNLGILYQARGEPVRAEEMYRKALQLFIKLESPRADRISELLDNLH